MGQATEGALLVAGIKVSSRLNPIFHLAILDFFCVLASKIFPHLFIVVWFTRYQR
jgi:hypothetical protein